MHDTNLQGILQQAIQQNQGKFICLVYSGGESIYLKPSAVGHGWLQGESLAGMLWNIRVDSINGFSFTDSL